MLTGDAAAANAGAAATVDRSDSAASRGVGVRMGTVRCVGILKA
ncbi:hypothetical protein BURPS1710b_A0933 [Burkholderia pseudomallei 1710b]|uniref:Uncharacterized protein n=1 Tax=Burkholderia pseudomallei (strain 1710b) TaxID=320372 RepID=Q3JK12_BURP1|nr:hypothetical protein BURPS1710b_A0933 [Burkholderia pseudomallei 1710b]